LSSDLMTVPAEEILDTEVFTTYIDGQLVYQRDE
jgi:predicted amidohydrolase YtcJ